MVTKRNQIARTTEEKWIVVVSYVIVGALSVSCLVPMLRVIADAFSSESAVMAGRVGLFPKDFSLTAFRYIVSSNQFVRSMFVSVLVTVLFTALSMVFTVVYVYPLSKSYLPKVRGFRFFTIFTMLFSGGMVPAFLVIRALGLVDSIWALILPGLINPFNAMVLFNFFRTIPADYEEAARIEGASHMTILTRVYIPMSKPTLLTLLLFYAVGRWNGWFDVVMYINDPKNYTLQVVLRNLLASARSYMQQLNVIIKAPAQSVQAAAVIFAIAPIIVLYPFLQKHFVKGIMIGGIKG